MTRSSRLAVMLAAVMLAGCASRVQHVTDIPTNAAGQPVATEDQVKRWDTAVANLHKISDTNTALRKGVIALNKSGKFPDGPAYVNTLTAIGRIAQIEVNSVDYLQQAPKTWGEATGPTIQANMWLIEQQLQNINAEGATGIKNPDSLSTVNQSLNNIKAIVDIILSLAGGKS